jgi:hypothetical protein
LKFNLYFEEKHHLIIAKKSVKFDSKRADWCNYLNMEEMYQESKGSTGLACEHQEARFACKTKFWLIQPDRLIFVDEVGNDASQTKGGQVGGQTNLCLAVDHSNKQQQRTHNSGYHY